MKERPPHPLRTFFLISIACARKSIYMANATFLEDLKLAREVTREEWSRRGWLARCNERLWVSFANQV